MMQAIFNDKTRGRRKNRLRKERSFKPHLEVLETRRVLCAGSECSAVFPSSDPDDIVGRHPQGGWYVARSTGNGFTDEKWTSWARVEWLDVNVGDVDGDTNTDIVGRHPSGRWFVARSDGFDFTTEQWTTWENVDWRNVHVADFTGDGRSDIVGRYTNGNWYVARSLRNEFNNEVWGSWSNTINWRDVQVGDFNGDGRADLFGRHPTRLYVATSNGLRFDTKEWTATGQWPRGTWSDVLVADVNADGRDDIVGRNSRGEWHVARSTGNSFIVEVWDTWANVEWKDVRVGDFNGDGRDDIAGRHPQGGWYVARSTGTEFISEKWTSWARVEWTDVLVMDANGDGRDDLAGRHPEGRWFVATSTGTSFFNRQWTTWDSRVVWSDVHAGRFAKNRMSATTGAKPGMSADSQTLTTSSSTSTLTTGILLLPIASYSIPSGTITVIELVPAKDASDDSIVFTAEDSVIEDADMVQTQVEDAGDAATTTIELLLDNSVDNDSLDELMASTRIW